MPAGRPTCRATHRQLPTVYLFATNEDPFDPDWRIRGAEAFLRPFLGAREYLHRGERWWLEPPTIPSDLIFALKNATLSDFAILTSAMHMAWLRRIGGRLKSDYRYSIGLVYNTFPMPPEDADLSTLEPLAQAVLDARSAHPDSTLADLYDPNLMPRALRKAHQTIDRAVDRLYRQARFTSERERVEHLVTLYEKMRAPLHAEMQPKPRRPRRRRTPV